MYLGVDLFEFIQLGLHWSFWMCQWMLYIKFGKSLTIILQILFVLVSLFFWGELPIMHVLVCFIMFHWVPKFCFFSPILLSFSFSNWIVLINFFSHPLITFSQVKSAFETLSWNVHFSYWIFLTPDFVFVNFLKMILNLLIFSVWWHVILILFFSSLCVIFFILLIYF